MGVACSIVGSFPDVELPMPPAVVPDISGFSVAIPVTVSGSRLTAVVSGASVCAEAEAEMIAIQNMASRARGENRSFIIIS